MLTKDEATTVMGNLADHVNRRLHLVNAQTAMKLDGRDWCIVIQPPGASWKGSITIRSLNAIHVTFRIHCSCSMNADEMRCFCDFVEALYSFRTETLQWSLDVIKDGRAS